MQTHNTRNIALCAAGESAWGLAAEMVATSTVFTVLLRGFGASKTMLGSVVAIETGAILMLQVFGLFVFASRRNRKRELLLWHVFAIIPFVFLIGIVAGFSGSLSPVVVRWTLLLSFAAFCSAIGVVVAVWTDWLAHIFEVKIRGTALGLSFGGSALAGTLGALAAGAIIRAVPSPIAYTYIYFIAGTLALISMAVYWLMKDPGENLEVDSTRPSAAEILAYARASLRDSNFRAYLTGRMLASAGFCVLPFVTVYYSSEAGGKLSDASIVSYGAAMALGSALGSFVLGRIGDTHGHFVGVVTSSVARVATLVAVLFIAGPVGCLAAFAGAGISNGAGFISHYNMLFETCPHDNRISHIMIGNLLTGGVGIAAALLAGAVATQWGVSALFWISLMISLAGCLWFVLFVKNPRAR